VVTHTSRALAVLREDAVPHLPGDRVAVRAATRPTGQSFSSPSACAMAANSSSGAAATRWWRL
jgi:hypothetical protein